MFVLLFVLLALRGVNNNARLRCQRLSDFNCFDKLPAVILGGVGGVGGRFWTTSEERKHIYFGESWNAFKSCFCWNVFGLGSLLK